MRDTDPTTPALAFGVLGPLEARHHGEPLRLGGRQQRAVLAMLVCRVGRAVSTDRLIEGVWPERVPAGAVTSLQTYVCHLRRALEPARPRGTPARVLVTAADGYQLAVERDAVDLGRFEDLVAAGDEALRLGLLADTVAAYDVALALWRGEVLADLADLKFVAPVRDRLEELRLAALQSRFEAELGLGRHRAVVPEAGALVREHPLREGFHAQRILALYRSGRQSEALAAYRDLRSLLDTELGVEPSPPLQELNVRVLRQDPALDLAARSG